MMRISTKRYLKKSFLFFLKFTGVFALVRHLTRHGIRILCYHGVWLGEEGFSGDGMFMNAETFKSRLSSIRKWGFPVLPLDTALQGLSDKELPSCPVVITIDDGWYGTYSSMLPALQHHGMPATLYCDTAHLQWQRPVPHVMVRYLNFLSASGYLGPIPTETISSSALYKDAINLEIDVLERFNKVCELAESMSIDIDRYISGRVFSYMEPEQLSQAYRSGMDVQLHTHTHSMHNFDTEAIRNDIEENRKQLSHIIGVEPERFKHFCYPSGEYSKDIGPLLEKIGIASATTIEQSLVFMGADRFFLPRIMDGEHLASIEFEAELCGIMEVLRKARRAIRLGFH
jgi:peptidoglycan/xylan/chitin deacetylase (PgdA/CDA1 family)